MRRTLTGLVASLFLMIFSTSCVTASTGASSSASGAQSGSGFDLKGLMGAGQNQGGQGGGIGDLIGGIANAFGFGGDLKFEDLVGTWKYQEPAVAFQSENLMMKAGGAAAAGMIEEKLAPYYKMAGCEQMTLEIAADSTFTMKLKLGTFSGKISQSEDGKQILFHFSIMQTINIGTMEAFINKKSSDEIEITYDVSGLLGILEKAGAMTKKSSIQTITNLLKQYDGITAGFALKKQ